MSTFTVRRYEPGDEQAILALFNGVFAEGNPGYVPRSMDTWRHIYLHNPAGHEILVAVDESGRIVGNYSAIPAFCNVRGERRRSAQAVDTCVDKAWRGSLRKNSVFVTIARRYCEIFGETNEAYTNEYMWGLPNEQAFPVGTRIVGYRPVHCPLPKRVRDADAAWVDDLFRRADGITLVESDGADLDQLAALFEQHLDQVPLGVWKSAEYLAWRYRDWPERPYHAVKAVRGDELVGALVYRLGWMGQPLVPLVDWIGSGGDEAAVAGLLGHVARAALDAGGRRLETWVTPASGHHATLSRLGMTEEPSPFNLCIMVYSDLFDFEWARDHWVVTMGDSDIY